MRERSAIQKTFPRRVLPTLVAILLAVPVSGETVQLSLKDAIDRALSDGTAARIASERIDQARFQARQAGAALLPQAGFEGTAINQSINLETFGLTLPGFPTIIPPFGFVDAHAKIALDVVDLAALKRWESARRGVAVGEAERERTINDVASAVATLYVALQRADASIEAARANVDLFGKLRDLANDQRNAGVATRLDSTRAEVALDRQQQALFVAQNRRETARLELLHATGQDQSVEVVLTDALQDTTETPPSPEEALRIARENRPELRVIAERLKAESLATDAERAERLPRVGVQYQGGYSGFHFDDMFWTRSVSALVSVPVFTGGRIAGRVAEARARERELALERIETERQIEEDVRRALLNWDNARHRVELARENERLANDELTFARDRFREGVSSSIEVDNAQTSLTQAQDDRIGALADAAQARFDLGRATGRIRDWVARP